MRRAGVLFELVLILSAGVAWSGQDWKAPATAKSMKNPVSMAEGAKTGQSVFQENCAICHGKGGKGDGEAAAAMNPVQVQTDGELFWKITEGREAMPSWKALSDKERWSLVDYIRSLAGKK